MAHFEAIAKSTSLPLILYNIPGRTGRLIDVKTLLALAQIDNIVGVKDAAANVNQTMALLAVTRKMSKKFYVLSGEDALTFGSLCLGGDGAIAAVAHVVGKELHEMMQAFARGDYKAAQDIHFRTLDVVNALFIESNPVPVKTALAMMGQPAGALRLPLVPMRPREPRRVAALLAGIGEDLGSWRRLTRTPHGLVGPAGRSAPPSGAGEEGSAAHRYCPVCSTPECDDDALDRLQSQQHQDAKRLYGNRLVSPTPEVVAFMAGWDVAGKGAADQSLVPFDLWVNRAHAHMLVCCAILTPDQGRGILDGLRRNRAPLPSRPIRRTTRPRRRSHQHRNLSERQPRH